MSLKTVKIKVSDIELPDVPLRAMDDETFKSLVRSISELGYVEPIQVVEKCGGGYKLLNGYHRFQVLKDVFNYSEVDAVVIGRLCCEGESENCMDEIDYYVNAIRLNNIHGEWRRGVLRDVLRMLMAWADSKGISREEVIKRLGKPDLIENMLKKQRKKEENAIKKSIMNACREVAMAQDVEDGSFVVFTFGGKLVLVYPLASKEEFYLVSSLLEELRSRGKDLVKALKEVVGK